MSAVYKKYAWKKMLCNPIHFLVSMSLDVLNFVLLLKKLEDDNRINICKF